MSDKDERDREFDSGNGPTPPERASEEPGSTDGSSEPVSAELLSAYLDAPDDLEPEIRLRLEQELATSAETRQTLHELEAIVHGLQTLPEIAAPRSYHLTPAMIGAPEPVQMQETSAWYVRHMGAVRWATAAAAILFVFVFTADLVTNGFGPSDPVAERSNFTTESGAGADEPSTLRAGDDDAEDASDMTEAQLQPPDESDEASDSAADVPATAADSEAEEEEAAGDSAGGAEAVPEPEQDTAQDDTAPTSLPDDGQSEGGEAEESGDPPITLNAPEDEATDAEADAIPEGDDGEGVGDADTSADTGINEEQPQESNVAAEDSSESSDNRTIWRAAEFSLILILALLLTMMIILPRLDRAPSGSRGSRR